ncbi:11206_t:CDS:2 [Racocetra fulgida]|uniref:11206_t:CDS:1 n=1 Tax=Racocetra fulgida TaxID=60492 RepID=A0A9N9AFN8_9GLOM|nr:11206_t:CDS:2 [Racocetra fulgida]
MSQANKKIAEIKEDVESSTPSVNTPSHSSVAEKSAAPFTTASTLFDPYPHYFMSAASSGYAYQYFKQPRTAAIVAAIGAAYAASIGLVVVSGPTAWATKDAFHVALGSLGAISLAGNALKMYQVRTGFPRNLEIKR